MNTKRILILWMALCMAVGAVAQSVPAAGQAKAVDDSCPLDSLPSLSKKERKELRTVLESYLDMWKTIGPSGNNPKLIFKDMDEKRIVVEVEYNLDEKTAEPFTSNYQWLRVFSIFEATHRLSDIFDMAIQLGLSAVLHAHIELPNGSQAAFATYDNATLRRILKMENHTQAYIYADMVTTRQKLPIQIDDSLLCTSISYCDHLYTLHLHSTAADDSTVSSQFAWMITNKYFIDNSSFLNYVGQDSTTLRIVGTIEGSRDTVVLDYRPAQLTGEEPAIDVDLAGQYLAMVLERDCPMPLDDSSGVWTHCSYDPSLKVVVMHYTVEELSILSVEGKEQQMKEPLLESLIYSDGAEFLSLLASAEVGMELRWQSRTTGRKVTITYTPDELINYLFEEE